MRPGATLFRTKFEGDRSDEWGWRCCLNFATKFGESSAWWPKLHCWQEIIKSISSPTSLPPDIVFSVQVHTSREGGGGAIPFESCLFNLLSLLKYESLLYVHFTFQSLSIHVWCLDSKLHSVETHSSPFIPMVLSGAPVDFCSSLVQSICTVPAALKLP